LGDLVEVDGVEGRVEGGPIGLGKIHGCI
jgi:hypothetical protein